MKEREKKLSSCSVLKKLVRQVSKSKEYIKMSMGCFYFLVQIKRVTQKKLFKMYNLKIIFYGFNVAQ